MKKFLLTVFLSTFTSVAVAQMPPTSDEISSYLGLHRAAHTGNIAEIARLASAGADPNIRDSRGEALHMLRLMRLRTMHCAHCPWPEQT